MHGKRALPLGRSRAFTVAASAAPVPTRHGLTVIPDLTRNALDDEILLPAPPSDRPARALDLALADLRRRFGEATADWVARVLEYPPART